MAVVVSRSQRLNMLNTWAATPFPGYQASAALFTNDFVPTDDEAVAAFTIADLAGLDQQDTLSWGGASEDVDGNYVKELLTAPFIAGATPEEPLLIYGWVIINAAGTVVLAAERFASARVITQIGESVAANPRVVWGN